MTTRNIVMRPANGSATVFQMNADAGVFSAGATSISSPALAATPRSGRSAGEGT